MISNKRWMKLPHLRRNPRGTSLPHQFRRLLTALLILTLPTLPGMSAVPKAVSDDPVQGDAGDGITKADDDDPALKEFLEAYRLEPGQVLKRVPKPRPEGVRIWWKQKYPNHGNQPHQFGALMFRWRDPNQLENWGGTTGDGHSLRSLLRYLEMNIYPAEIDGDVKLLDTIVTGDWIFRDGVNEERMIRALEAILQRTLRLRISLAFRQVEREVVVARGRYRLARVAGQTKDEIEIYGKQIVPGGGGAGGGTGTFSEFLKWVGEWIERPVVSEVEAPPKERVTWNYNARSPFTEQMRREDHDEALVLQHLQEQTGLTFTRERRTIRILFIERAK